MLTASASTRSDLTLRCARSTAVSGGLPGLIARYATCIEDTTSQYATVTTSRSVDSGCIRPSTGTGGSGSSTVITSATARPDSRLAAEMLPHNRTQTNTSQQTIQIRSALCLTAHLPAPR